MSSVILVGVEPNGAILCGVFRNEATFFNHSDMLSQFSCGVEYTAGMMTKKQVKAMLTIWASGGLSDSLFELPCPYPNFSTFTWKHSSMNVDPHKHPKSDMKTTLSSQPFCMLRFSNSTFDAVKKMLVDGRTVCFRTDIPSHSAYLFNTNERRQVNVMGALQLMSGPLITSTPMFSPNKRRRLETTMPVTPLTETPLELVRRSSSMSYVSLLSPESVKSITSNFNRENKLWDETEQPAGLYTPPLTSSPSFQIEFTQNCVLTPVKTPVKFLQSIHCYSE